MICPGCNGNKQACIGAGGDVPGAKVFAWYKCSRCAGAGEVMPELYAAWLAGQASRDHRIRRKETIRAAAERLGTTVAALCDFANGRIDFAALPAAKEAS